MDPRPRLVSGQALRFAACLPGRRIRHVFAWVGWHALRRLRHHAGRRAERAAPRSCPGDRGGAGAESGGPSTNYIANSSQIRPTPWGGTGVSASDANSIIAGATASKLNVSSGGVRTIFATSSVPAGQAEISYILEEVVSESVGTAFNLNAGSHDFGVRFNWSTKAFSDWASSGNVRVARYLGVGPNGGSLYLLSVRNTVRANASTYLYPGGDGTVSTDRSVIAHFAGLSTSAFPTTPVLTTGASAQRLADSLSYAIAGTSEGTVVVSARTPLGADGNQTLWCWDDGTTANRYRLVRDSARHLRFIVTVSGTDVVNLDLGTVADDTAFKVAASWKSGQFVASLNGAAAVTDSTYAGALPTVTTMREGSSSNGSEWFGTIKRMRRYSTAYSAAQLPGMSS